MCSNEKYKYTKRKKNDEVSLITLIYDDKMDLDFTYDPLCSICLIEYEYGDEIAILKCNHNYHKKCIQDYFKLIDKQCLICPFCRVQLNN
jgi:hypothetical protein